MEVPSQPDDRHDAGNVSRPINLDYELSKGNTRKLIRGYVSRVVRKLNLQDADREDLNQWVSLELVRRSSQFDPKRGTWISFAAVVVSTSLKTSVDLVLKSRRRETQGNPSDFEQFESPYGLHETTDQRLDVEQIVSCLPDEQRELCDQISCDPVAKVARNNKIPRRTLRDRIHKLRRPFSDLAPEKD